MSRSQQLWLIVLIWFLMEPNETGRVTGAETPTGSIPTSGRGVMAQELRQADHNNKLVLELPTINFTRLYNEVPLINLSRLYSRLFNSTKEKTTEETTVEEVPVQRQNTRITESPIQQPGYTYAYNGYYVPDQAGIISSGMQRSGSAADAKQAVNIQVPNGANLQQLLGGYPYGFGQGYGQGYGPGYGHHHGHGHSHGPGFGSGFGSGFGAGYGYNLPDYAQLYGANNNYNSIPGLQVQKLYPNYANLYGNPAFYNYINYNNRLRRGSYRRRGISSQFADFQPYQTSSQQGFGLAQGYEDAADELEDYGEEEQSIDSFGDEFGDDYGIDEGDDYGEEEDYGDGDELWRNADSPALKQKSKLKTGRKNASKKAKKEPKRRLVIN